MPQQFRALAASAMVHALIVLLLWLGVLLHPLKVSGNWRVTFLFVGKDADDVDYQDYH